ncbi:MAG TPA: selenocysteine-specific translation elongation factor [Vicinamibacterales bacterium]|nr:selenocysteine-specific translation elongation factor [Vicinamibacterales bacterium]
MPTVERQAPIGETRSVVIGTAGHIDHGKSALVMALTGTDPDRLKEEKARGITIDLGFAHARVGGTNLAFVDVPGHERFVKNMLAGVGGIDAVLLVIAADESVMPQTREHFAICRLLRVPRGVIVLTKSDLVDADTLELARLDARELVAGSLLAGAPIVAVSAKTGTGLDALREALARLAETVPLHGEAGAPRLPIDRVFSMRGFGTVVTGTLTSGTIRAEDELVVLPSERRVKVRGIQVHGAAHPSASAGRRVAVNLGGIDVGEITRGDVLTRAGAFEATRRFDVAIDLLSDARPLRHGTRVRFHQGTTELLGRVALASAADDADRAAADLAGDGDQAESQNDRRRGRGGLAELKPGGRAFARVRLEAPAVLTRGDRFIIRAYSPAVTIGGGRVLDPHPARTPIRTVAAAARFARLDAHSPSPGDGDADAVLAFVEERRAAGLGLDAVARRAGVTDAAAVAIANALAAAGQVVVIGQQLFSAALVRTLENKVMTAVADHHRGTPMSEGLPREEARERIFSLAAPALFDEVLRRLEKEGKLSGRDRLAQPGRGVSLTPEEMRAQEALDRVFRDAALAPPDLAAAAASASVPMPVAERVFKLLLRQKTLVKVDTLVFHAQALERLKQEVVALKGKGPGKVDVAGFKERYGISRKYAIPLLEWLDRERITRRVGDARVIL